MEKVIFLVDMNAFFISCEISRNPELKGKPAAVAGDPKRRSGIILAANYEARGFGVRTTMLLHEAKKLCPEIVFVPPDHSFYEKKSSEVMNILSRYTPAIEQNSIDEAWLDLTASEALFGKPREIAEKIMNNIRNELDLWCSIGISENKFLSKMASEMKKPLGITELWVRDIKQKLWPLPIRDMYGIGKQTETKLHQLGIETIGDLAGYDRKFLTGTFGKYGAELQSLANGKDISEVIERRHDEMKSISRSRTLPVDITDFEQAKRIIMGLAEEIGSEARKYGKKGRTVSISIKYGDFHSITRQKKIQATYLTKDLNIAGLELLSNYWDSHRPVRLLGIGLSGFSDYNEMEQISLFNFFDEPNTGMQTNEYIPQEDGYLFRENKEEKLEMAIDAIRAKHGAKTINRAVLIKNWKK